MDLFNQTKKKRIFFQIIFQFFFSFVLTIFQTLSFFFDFVEEMKTIKYRKINNKKLYIHHEEEPIENPHFSSRLFY